MSRRTIMPWLGNVDAKSVALIDRLAPLISGVAIGPVRRQGKVNWPLMKEVVDACRSRGLTTRLCISGPPEEYATRAAAKSALAYWVQRCEEAGFEGFDLDYEHHPARYRQAYSAYMRDLKKASTQRNWKLDICVNYLDHIHHQGTEIMFQDPDVVAECCDQVRVMCYDFFFAYGRGKSELKDRGDCFGWGPVATVPWSRAAMRFWNRFVPASRLVMGLPAYGNDFNLSRLSRGRQVYFPQKERSFVGSKGWSKIEHWWDEIPVHLYRDDKGQAHVYYGFGGSMTQRMLRVATELKIPTVAFWYAGSTTKQMWEAAAEWAGKPTPDLKGFPKDYR